MKTKLKPATYLVLLMLFSAHIVCSQEKDKIKQHELSLNMPYFLGGLFEANYSHILNDESSIGISGGFSFDSAIEYQFFLIPNYRIFFGEKIADGYFIETNVAFFSRDEQVDAFFGTVNANNNLKKIGFGVGFAFGRKFLSKKGFIGEVFLGMGRNFINTEEIGTVYPRFGISIGKRF